MNENDLFNFQLEYTFTADWLAELDRQLALLLSTREGHHAVGSGFRPEHGFCGYAARGRKEPLRRRSPKRCPNSYRRCGCSEGPGPAATPGNRKFFPRW